MACDAGFGDDSGVATVPTLKATRTHWLTRHPQRITNEKIVLRGVPFFSLCEHHLLPFVGTAIVGYVPAARIVGLWKIPRLVHHYARGLQNQERLVQQVAECLEDTLQPKASA